MNEAWAGIQKSFLLTQVCFFICHVIYEKSGNSLILFPLHTVSSSPGNLTRFSLHFGIQNSTKSWLCPLKNNPDWNLASFFHLKILDFFQFRGISFSFLLGYRFITTCTFPSHCRSVCAGSSPCPLFAPEIPACYCPISLSSLSCWLSVNIFKNPKKKIFLSSFLFDEFCWGIVSIP